MHRYEFSNYHPNDIKFCINEMAKQVRQKVMSILASSLYFCIIADEWSCKHSKKEYVSVSLCYVKQDLTYGTVFIRFFVIPNTKAVEVTRAIIKALSVEEPKVDLSKGTAQTYDGAKNMQGHLSGVQKRIKDGYCPFF